MDVPLVTVICLCFNHERFVREAITSVLKQTYPRLQIIVGDDASTDNSVGEIEKIVAENPFITFLPLPENLGNTRAFNECLALAKGDYIVDFSTDDVMIPERIEEQVKMFMSLDDSYGVVFTDADYIDENGNVLRGHFQHLFEKGLLKSIPQGDVYYHVLQTYFICSPTMLVKRNVFEDLKGYDSDLAYEDFDFWVRSSRYYRYAFLNKKLTKVRRSAKSLSTGWYRRGDKQLYSTYLVCKKAQALNQSPEEKQALINRLRFELRQSVFSENRKEAKLFYQLLRELRRPLWVDHLLVAINELHLPLAPIRRLYHYIRFS